MATGQLQALRHEIRDIVGDGATYNGLAGKAGLSFDAQRAEFNSVEGRVAEKVASLRAKADELEAKQEQIAAIVVNALGIIDQREEDPEFAPAEPAEEDEEADDEDWDEEDFEEYEDEDLK